MACLRRLARRKRKTAGWWEGSAAAAVELLDAGEIHQLDMALANLDQAGFGETATQQRSDVEGSSFDKQPTGEAESGFVGSEGRADTSSELVEDEDQDFSKDGQGAPEGK